MSVLEFQQAELHEAVPLKMDGDGVWRVGGYRVTLDTIVGAFQDGATPEEIAQQYPPLPLADIYAVIGYYLHHQPEVEADLERRQREAEVLRREVEARFDQRGIRERLLARRARMKNDSLGS